MEDMSIDSNEVCSILNEIMEYELAGVVRYTHSSMMVSGPYRLPIVTFFERTSSRVFASCSTCRRENCWA